MRHMQPCTYFRNTFPVLCGSLCHLTLCSGEIYIPAAWSLPLYWRLISIMISSNARNVAAQCWIEPQSRADYPNLVWPRTLVLAWELSQEEWMSVTFHILLPQGGQKVKMRETKVPVWWTQSSTISIWTGVFLVNKIFTTTMLPMKKWHNHHW